jgi:predicted phosphodiesterase
LANRKKTILTFVSPRILVIHFIMSVFLLGALTGCARSGGSVQDEYPKLLPTKELPASSTPSKTPPTLTPTIAPTLEPTIPPPSYDSLKPLGEYVIPLTLQHVSGTSADLYFMLESPAEGAVFYSLKGDQSNRVQWITFNATTDAHLIKVSDLEPGASYEVWVGVSDDDGIHYPPSFADGIWNPITLRVPKENDWPIRIGVIGDSGFGEAVTYQLAEEMASHFPEFVIHTGDLVYSVYQDSSPPDAFIRKLYQPMAELLHIAPIYPVFGNHEGYGDTFWRDRPFYYTAFPPLENGLSGDDFGGISDQRDWYAFSRGEYQFIFLNSQQFYSAKFLEEQNAWLQEKLVDNTSLTNIVIFHIPPFTSGRHRDDGVPIRQAWVPLFEDGDVVLVLSGHDHNYERLELNGITYIVSGGGSNKLYGKQETREESKFFAAQSHFVILDLYPDHVETTAYGLGGEILDSHTLRLPPSS